MKDGKIVAVDARDMPQSLRFTEGVHTSSIVWHLLFLLVYYVELMFINSLSYRTFITIINFFTS